MYNVYVCLFIIFLFSLFFFSSRRRHTSSVSAFLLNRSSDLAFPELNAWERAVSDKLLDLVGLGGKSAADKGKRSEERRVGKECTARSIAETWQNNYAE